MNSITKGFAAEGAPEEWSVELELCGSVKFWAKPKAAITIHLVSLVCWTLSNGHRLKAGEGTPAL